MTEARWIRRREVLARRVPDGVLLLALEASEPVLVTGSGAMLWELLGERRGIDDLVATAAILFGVEPSDITTDIEQAVSALAAHGLLEAAP